MSIAVVVVLVVVMLAIVVTVYKAVVVIPQASAAVVERLGRYRSTFTPGLNFLVPFIDRIRDRIDLREQVVSFPPQSVITKDNLTVDIDTVVYFRVVSCPACLTRPLGVGGSGSVGSS
jgi:regulator of protease activity HflC (stomatin/prohibitin superfamily)